MRVCSLIPIHLFSFCLSSRFRVPSHCDLLTSLFHFFCFPSLPLRFLLSCVSVREPPQPVVDYSDEEGESWSPMFSLGI